MGTIIAIHAERLLTGSKSAFSFFKSSFAIGASFFDVIISVHLI